MSGKEGRKGARRGAIGALRAPEWRGEWTPDPGKEKPRRANHTGQRERVAYSSTVACKGGKDHEGNEQSAKEKIA